MAVRSVPAAACVLYDSGAEGWPLEGGWDQYDIPALQLQIDHEDESAYGQPVKAWSYDASFRQAPYSPAGNYEPSIMVIKELNVVCPAPRPVLQDMPNPLSTSWNFFGGSWERVNTIRPPIKARLVQRSSSPNTVWRAESFGFLPKNPNLCFTIQRLDNHPAHDTSTYPGYVQIIISDQWALRFSESHTAGVWAKVAGSWQQQKHLAWTARGQELLIYFMVKRGAVVISVNEGQKWETFRGAVAIDVAQGILSVEGAGCQMAFGHHQLAGDNCWYETYDIPVLEEHFGTPTFTYAGFLGGGTSIIASELASTPGSFKYHVDLKVSHFFVANFQWDFYNFPEIYATQWSWPTILAAPIGSSVDLASIGVLEEIDVHESTENNQNGYGGLGPRQGHIKLMWDPVTAFTGSYGMRLVTISLGYMMSDGTFDLVSRCAMYVVEPSPESRSGEWDSHLEFEMTDVWVRATTTKVDEGWAPMDGLSCTQARNYILLKMGLPTSRGAWYSTGLVLPAGPVDRPRWWAKPGMSAAELFHAIDVYEGTETFTDSLGNFGSQPMQFVNGSLNYTFNGDPGAGFEDFRVKSLKYTASHRDSKTAVLVEGKDLRNQRFWATSIDYNLERVPATGGFIGHRRWERLENQPIVSLAQAVALANQRRSLLSEVPQVLEAVVPGLHTIYRDNRIAFNNCTAEGVDPTNRFRVEALDFKWRPIRRDCETVIRARRFI